MSWRIEDPRQDERCDTPSECRVCGCMTYEGEEYGHGYVCPDCADRHMVESDGCGCEVLDTDAEQIDGEWYCEECLEAKHG